MKYIISVFLDKLYWNIATFALDTIHSCFCFSTAKVELQQRPQRPSGPQSLMHLQKKCAGHCAKVLFSLRHTTLDLWMMLTISPAAYVFREKIQESWKTLNWLGWGYRLEASEYCLFPTGENSNQSFLNLGGSTHERHSILWEATKGLKDTALYQKLS